MNEFGLWLYIIAILFFLWIVVSLTGRIFGGFND